MGQNPGFCFYLIHVSTRFSLAPGKPCVGGTAVSSGFGKNIAAVSFHPLFFLLLCLKSWTLGSATRIGLFMDLHLPSLVFSVTFYSSGLRYFLCFTKPVIVFPVHFCLFGLVFWQCPSLLPRLAWTPPALAPQWLRHYRFATLSGSPCFLGFLNVCPPTPGLSVCLPVPFVDFIPFIIP